ncbi:phosphotransferase family protein [Sphingomicrobium sediminis]|uniref:Phosphotransferase family protein n=1 Tax=Sphingomicrobium sediminis TaxID=2950949 RepID=A0A9X2J2R6_9SPHN|nr:phosphotransferase family protein [Sphingomicrobium sediminis]MCM8557305.1 phosphotransferase family protein [Sphingomicrobium sediminis]
MDRTSANTGTRPVSDRLAFDENSLTQWMQKHVEGFEGPLEVEQFKGGQSNPTYKLTAKSGQYVLRRKPPGRLLPGAHAVEREYRVMTQLGLNGFPAPRTHGLEEDAEIIGTPFFVMDMVPGRIIWEAHFPDTDDRAAHFDAMNATIAQLHSFDPAAIGLCDYGKGEDFIARQVARWSGQYVNDVEAGRVEAMDKLVDWLKDNAPDRSGEPVRVIHGDFRCDNMIFDAEKPEVLAVLDWELSTLGDPGADFAYHLLMYRMPSAGSFTGLLGRDLAELGIPSEADYVAAYCERTGRDGVADLDYLIVYNMFRLAAIVHGIKGRVARGNASSAHAVETAKALEPLAELAWANAQAARL